MDIHSQNTPYDKFFNGNPRLMAEAGTLGEFIHHKKIWINISPKEKNLLIKLNKAVAEKIKKKEENREKELEEIEKKIAKRKPVYNK